MLDRDITISTDVFARIWSLRESGESTEDAILRRVLAAPASQVLAAGSPSQQDGFYDLRHQVSFPEGFEIFRTYLGVPQRAIATKGKWKLRSGGAYASLNQLSRALGAKTENAWRNWFYLDSDGMRRAIGELRSSETSREGSEIVLEDEMTGASREATWLEDVEATLRFGGKPMCLNDIYEMVRARRQLHGRSIPTSLDAIVRRTLEEQSSDSDAFKGRANLFCMSEGKGKGVWRLRQ